MEQKIIDTFREHKRRYGSRRISRSLQKTGEKVGRYKVSKTLWQYGLKAIQPRSFVPKTTNSRHRCHSLYRIKKERITSLNSAVSEAIASKPTQNNNCGYKLKAITVNYSIISSYRYKLFVGTSCK